jgi:hypothetical protein
LTITARYPNRLVVDVEAPVAVIERALSVAVNSYQIGEVPHFSNDRAPSVPAALAGVIQNVLGLDDIQIMRRSSGAKQQPVYRVYSPGPAYALGSHLTADGDQERLEKRRQGRQKAPNPYFSYNGYDPTDLYLSYAYNYGALKNLGHCCNPLNHPGNSPPESSIAIAIWGDFADSDFTTWVNTYGFAGNVQRVFVDGTPTCCDIEPTADVEYATAMANSFADSASTAKVYAYEGANGQLSTVLDVLNRALSDGKARVLNMSWGGAESYNVPYQTMNSYHNVFNQFAGRGWTLVASSGDGGATADCVHSSISFPASDPNVTGVGGTSLRFSGNGYSRENAWHGDYCEVNDGGSGGGCSRYFNTPGYQGSKGCSNDNRSTPDIALNADADYAPQRIFYNGGFVPVGGTSISAPEIAGFIAQENAYLLYIQGKVGDTCGPNLSAPCAPMGSANPYLYSIGLNGRVPHYPFYDITTGCNSNDITDGYGLTYYCAAAGYDRVTGWGSANMLQLAWDVNNMLAGDSSGPTAAITGPPTNVWYTTDQSVSWALTDSSANGHSPVGVAGSSMSWDVDPGDPYSQPTPGGNNSYYGPQFNGAGGSASGLINLSNGCHTVYVRAWDNGGNSGASTYGPLCLDTVAPSTAINLAGNGSYGQYSGPVQVSLTATDNASGVAATFIAVDYGPFLNYAGPFYSYLPGNHCIEAYSVDVAGNVGSPYPQCFNINSNSQFNLSVSKTGTGSGTVTSTDGAIHCGSTCSAAYWDEEPVTLTAAPANGSLFTGWRNCDSSFGFNCTATVTAARTVTAMFNLPVALQFVPLAPCRVVDTRLPDGPFGGPAIAGGASRDFVIPSGPCPNIPSDAAAYSLNVTTVPHGYLAYLSAWATGFTRPQTSVMNSFDGRIKASADILPAGDSSSISIYVSNTANVVLDIDGYFVGPSGSTLAFFPLTPCRVADTRQSNGPLSGPTLAKGQVRDFPILQATACDIPMSAQAYSFNVTAIPKDGQSLAYLTAWPAGSPQPGVSTLNALTGAITANAAIIPAGSGGDINFLPAGADTDMVLDINGYFAPSPSGSAPLSLYSFASCRVLDTRQSGGFFNGQITVNVAGSACMVPSTAQGYVFNATVLPSGVLGYLTLWPDGQNQPLVSTLNALDGSVTSNMAIVPTSNGSIDAYAAGLTHLLLDISSYFAP